MESADAAAVALALETLLRRHGEVTLRFTQPFSGGERFAIRLSGRDLPEHTIADGTSLAHALSYLCPIRQYDPSTGRPETPEASEKRLDESVRHATRGRKAGETARRRMVWILESIRNAFVAGRSRRSR